MKKLLFIIFVFLCGCYSAGMDTRRPAAPETTVIQEQPQPPVKHKTLAVPLNVTSASKEKAETTEEYLFWIILGVIGTIISAVILIKRKKIAAHIIKRSNKGKHPKHHK